MKKWTHRYRYTLKFPQHIDRVVKVAMPEGMTRPETGPMQFGDDWPGVFIRGDNAFHMAMLMRLGAKALRVSIDDELSATQLDNYAKTLASCVNPNY